MAMYELPPSQSGLRDPTSLEARIDNYYKSQREVGASRLDNIAYVSSYNCGHIAYTNARLLINHQLHAYLYEYIYIYIIYYIYICTTTQCKLLQHKWSMCASRWNENDHQRKLQWVAPPPVQGVFAPIMAEGKRHQCKLQPVTTTMCASGVLALVDRR